VNILGLLRKLLRNIEKIGRREKYLSLTSGRPGAWKTDLVHFVINGNIN
jgi:hypothetical protein